MSKLNPSSSTIRKWINDAGSIRTEIAPSLKKLVSLEEKIKSVLVHSSNTQGKGTSTSIGTNSFIAQVSAVGNTNVLKDIEQVYKALGRKKFLALAKISITDLKKEVTKEELERLTEQKPNDPSKNRRLTITKKGD